MKHGSLQWTPGSHMLVCGRRSVLRLCVQANLSRGTISLHFKYINNTRCRSEKAFFFFFLLLGTIRVNSSGCWRTSRVGCVGGKGGGGARDVVRRLRRSMCRTPRPSHVYIAGGKKEASRRHQQGNYGTSCTTTGKIKWCQWSPTDQNCKENE